MIPYIICKYISIQKYYQCERNDDQTSGLEAVMRRRAIHASMTIP